MRTSCNQRGVSLIAAIFIIVVLAFMGVMFVALIGSGTFTAINDLQSAQALSVAEGGLEYAIKNGTYCTYNYTNIPLGASGSFTVSSQLSNGTTGALLDNIADPADVQLTASPAGFATPGVVTVDSENLLCTGKDIGTNRLTSCKRAWAGSIKTAHSAGAAVSQCAVMSVGAVGSARRNVSAAFSTGGLIAFDAGSSGSGNGNSLTWAHTVSGADRFLMVGISIRNDSGQTVSSVTYAGSGLTKIGERNSGVNSVRIETWTLVNPTLGTQNIVVTLAGGLSAVAVTGAVSLTGVDQASPIAVAFNSAAATSNAPSVTLLNVPAGSWVIDTLAFRQNETATVSAAPNRLERWNLSFSGGPNRVNGAGSTREVAAMGNITMNWTLTGAQDWALGAVAIRSAAGGGAKVLSWQEMVN